MTRNRLHLSLFVWLGLGLIVAPGQTAAESLDSAEQIAVENSFQYALEYNRSGTVASWSNPTTGRTGATVPVRTFQTATGTYCREFQQTIIIADREQQGYGIACRQADGYWQIVDPRSFDEGVLQIVQRPLVRPYYYPQVPFRYAYPYWLYPTTFSFSFGYIERRGYPHFYRPHHPSRSRNAPFRGRRDGHPWRRGRGHR